MSQQLLAGIGAGIISFIALMSATTGTPALQFLLFLVAPLPIYLVGLALGWTAAAIASLTAFLAIAALAGPMVAAIAAGTQFGPAVYLTYLALLNRPVPAPDGGGVTVEWYPVGRLVLWCAVFGTVLSMALLLLLGKDHAELQDNLQKILRQAIEQTVAQQSADGAKIPDEHIDQMTRVAAALLPVASGMLMTGIQLLALYLAARVTHASGLLARPWPDLAAITFPAGTPVILAASVLLTAVLDGYPGLGAAAASGAFYFAYLLLGLAIVHYVTRGNPWRFMLLWGVYFGLIVFNTVFSLVIAIIGLAEPFSPIRRDFVGNPPPTPPPNSGNDN